MTIQYGKHDMYKNNIASIRKVIAGNDVPTVVAVMTLATLPNIQS